MFLIIVDLTGIGQSGFVVYITESRTSQKMPTLVFPQNVISTVQAPATSLIHLFTLVYITNVTSTMQAHDSGSLWL
jgi:hypothetical protein